MNQKEHELVKKQAQMIINLALNLLSDRWQAFRYKSDNQDNQEITINRPAPDTLELEFSEYGWEPKTVRFTISSQTLEYIDINLDVDFDTAAYLGKISDFLSSIYEGN